ncbi:antibiotic ABC transporter ATP-binding protein [Amycolatopsis thailandensis]|uniref:Antibiotic ABC transporter ATP-binding protein n=2 Tax=Amycolatopsis thailandensis TaxID=589330 RepID=A0A229SCF4_9PSEU|nr:antibiotic ABC transporter ATP-binding protein [Amycolatopsis thailandensis]
MVVHGVGQEFRGPELMCQSVGPALRDGVRLSGGPALSAGDVACVFYGDVFFEPGSRTGDVPPWDEFDVETGFEAELLEAWWEYAASVDPAVAGPDEQGTRGAVGYALSRPLLIRRVRAALNALTGLPFFEKVSDRMLVFALKQVRRYMTEPSVRVAARERVAAAVGAETRVVVAHSLGSVVAYEALCANPRWPVTDFVTVGSPLGLRSVIFDRLDPAPVDGAGVWPAGVRRWTNIADPGDVVALAGVLADRFGDRVVDVPITNGARMHDLLRYLTAPSVGTAVARGLPEANDAGETGHRRD